VGNSNSHCNVANKKIKMKKEKLYNPDKCGTFEMQFGFEQPLKYIPNTRKQKRNENNRNYKQPSQKSV
jgi:hypothetical protein